MRNLSRLASVSVYLEAYEIRDDAGAPAGAGLRAAAAAAAPPRLPPITPGESETVHVPLTGTRPGRYRVTVKGTSKMGVLRWRVPVTADVPVQVFKRFGEAKRDPYRFGADRKSCMVEFTIEAGAVSKEGEDCELIMPAGAGARIRAVGWSEHVIQPVDILPEPAVPFAADMTSKAEWKLHSIPAFSTAHFTVELAAPVGHTPDEWRAIAGQLQFKPD
jgi:hypothetical protein